MSASVRSKVRQAADAEATHPNRLGAPAINLPISRQPTAGVVGRVRVLHERAVRGHRSDVDQDAGAPRAQDAQPVPITDSGALDRGRTASADRRFRVRHPPARRVFCAASDERSGASRSGRGCESDIVTARDPSTDSRDGFTAAFRLPHARTSPAPPVPRTTGHRCATSSPRRATRDRPDPDHRRRPQRMLGLVVLGLRVGPQCRNAITMASVMVEEIRLRAHARPLDEPGERAVCARRRWGNDDRERTVPWFTCAPGGRFAARVVRLRGGVTPAGAGAVYG
jgi:hypothetical protein